MNEIRNRIYRIKLLIGCLASAIIRGRASNSPKNVSAVIVVLTGKLGDVVCGTPVLRALRKHLPNTRIIVAGGPMIRPVLSDSGLADEYLDLESPGAVGRIKALGAGVGLVTGPSFVPTALLYLAGVSLVVAPRVEGGDSLGDTLPYKILRRFIATFPYKMGEYAPRERLRALEPIGIFTEDTKKQLGFSETAAKKVIQIWGERDITDKDFVVGMSPSAGNKIKEWPEERFAEVADYLITQHKAKVFLIGGPGDSQKVDKMLKNMKHGKEAVNLQGELNVDELKAFISKLNFFVSVDTGPIYIAEAFGVPTINIVGPMNENEQPPRGHIHRNVLPPYNRKPQLSILNARLYDKGEALRQTFSITSKAVIDEIDRLITNLRAGEGSRL